MAALAAWSDCSGRYEAAMRIPDFTLLLGRKFLELLDTQAESESSKSNGPIAPILDPHGSVKLKSVHRAKGAKPLDLPADWNRRKCCTNGRLEAYQDRRTGACDSSPALEGQGEEAASQGKGSSMKKSLSQSYLEYRSGITSRTALVILGGFNRSYLKDYLLYSPGVHHAQ